MAVACDSPPPAVPPQSTEAPVRPVTIHPTVYDPPVSVSQELDEINSLAQQLERPMPPPEAFLEYERAGQNRARALMAWKKLNVQLETDASLTEKERQARERYYETRVDAERALQRVGEFLK